MDTVLSHTRAPLTIYIFLQVFI